MKSIGIISVAPVMDRSSAPTSFVLRAKPVPVLMHTALTPRVCILAGFPMQWTALPPTTRRLRGDSRYAQLGDRRPRTVGPLRLVCVRVDSRGAGRSPGFIDCLVDRARSTTFPNASNGLEGKNHEQREDRPGGVFIIRSNTVEGGRQAAQASGGHLHVRGLHDDIYRDACRHGGILNTSDGSGIRTRSQTSRTAWLGAPA